MKNQDRYSPCFTPTSTEPVRTRQMLKYAFRILLAFGSLPGTMCLLVGNSQAQQMPIRANTSFARQVVSVKQEITPPPSAAVYARPGSVTLKPGSTSTLMKSLTIKKRYPLDLLRKQPVIMLGKSRIDIKPLFRNPASLNNIAGRLRSHPALTSVISEKTEVIMVEQGLIVRQFLNYHVKTGVCSNPTRRQQLKRSGADCFTRLTAAGRTAAYANPNDPHYVANPAKRAKVIAATAKETAKERTEFTKGIAKFRAMMNDPAQRAKVISEVGPKEADRLAALGDDQLEAELINSADTQIEDVMFIPDHGKLDDMQASKTRFHIPKANIPEKVDIEHSLQPHIFLTGFTLGREYEWRRRVSVTVKACLVGCKKTYFAEVYAGFGYGFGLRFPIKMGGLYAYHRVGLQESASVAPVFEPINGSASDYAETGLPSDKIFKGRELVAELTAYAGMNFKVPFHSDGVSTNAGKDLTEGLPAPFTNGQFKPPAPGESNALDKEVFFNDTDLLVGLANYGVVGAKILPAIKVGLTSDRLRLKLKDNLSGRETEMLNSGRTYPLAVDHKDHSSSFTIGYPDYRLAFQVTPGLDARLFVDVSIWSHNWDWPVWFPQVAITLPPGGMDFTCHERTICSRDYRYSPTVTQEKQGAVQPPNDQMEREVFNWRNAYRKKYLPQCPYLPLRFCETAIEAVAQTTGNQILNEMRAQPKYPSKETASIMIKKAINADKKGKDIILETKIASVDYYGKNLFKTYEPIWSHDCADRLCRVRIHALGQPYVKALKDRQKDSPLLDRNAVVFQENTQGNWAGRAKQEVEASQNRVGTRATVRPSRLTHKIQKEIKPPRFKKAILH